MESTQKQQNVKLAGIILITLVIGLLLGAFFYSKIAGTNPSTDSPTAPEAKGEKTAEISETTPDAVQISA